MPLQTVKQKDVPSVDIDLKMPPDERWREAGKAILDHVHGMVDDVLECCEESLDGWLARWPYVMRGFIRLLAEPVAGLGGRVAGRVASWFGQEYPAEIEGLAKATKIPYPHLLLGNLMYDISQRCACSSYSCNLRNGIPILARNLDWGIPASLGRHTVLIQFHRGKDQYLSVGVAGMVGVLSAMFPGRWAITLNLAPSNKLGLNGWQTPVLQHVRNCCDQFGGFQQLVRRLQAYQTMSPFFAHVVGLKRDEQVVVNGFGQEVSTRRLEDGVLVQTNHFVEDEFSEYNPDDEEWIDENGITWVFDSPKRYRVLTKRLKRRPASLAAALEKLKNAPITNDSTMQSMVFCPSSGRWLLKVRR